MPRIRLKLLLTHTWILFINVAVNRSVADPYNNTDLTFEEKILSVAFVVRDVVRHTALSRANACHALLIDACLDIFACARTA